MLKFIYTNRHCIYCLSTISQDHTLYTLEVRSVLFTFWHKHKGYSLSKTINLIRSLDSYCTACNKKIIIIAFTIHDLFSLYIVSKNLINLKKKSTRSIDMILIQFSKFSLIQYILHLIFLRIRKNNTHKFHKFKRKFYIKIR